MHSEVRHFTISHAEGQHACHLLLLEQLEGRTASFGGVPIDGIGVAGVARTQSGTRPFDWREHTGERRVVYAEGSGTHRASDALDQKAPRIMLRLAGSTTALAYAFLERHFLGDAECTAAGCISCRTWAGMR